MIQRDAKILCRRLRRYGFRCYVARIPRGEGRKDVGWGVVNAWSFIGMSHVACRAGLPTCELWARLTCDLPPSVRAVVAGWPPQNWTWDHLVNCPPNISSLATLSLAWTLDNPVNPDTLPPPETT